MQKLTEVNSSSLVFHRSLFEKRFVDVVKEFLQAFLKPHNFTLFTGSLGNK